jgi:tetraacyldisaccharide 4'-kinase
MRNRLYERSYLGIHRLPTSVISVGNLTIGGSGKTPLVAHVSRFYLSKGNRVAVLSRGYRRQGSSPFLVVSDGQNVLAGVAEAGDEPLELVRSVQGLVVAVGGDRFRTGLEVVRGLGPHLFVLDDGFQHRRLHRDLDLVCVDSGESQGNLRVLPAGRLREPLSSLNRAGGLIWTRWKRGRPCDALASQVLGGLDAEIPVFRASQSVAGFYRLGGDGEALVPGAFEGEPVGLLAAIARPERLREDLESCGAHVVWSSLRRDHHAWRAEEVVQLIGDARARGAQAVITTGKDAVKLEALGDTPLPVYRMDLRTEILEREEFEKLLDTVPPPQ